MGSDDTAYRARFRDDAGRPESSGPRGGNAPPRRGAAAFAVRDQGVIDGTGAEAEPDAMETNMATPLQGYDADEGASHSHGYLFPVLLRILAERPAGRIFELGCGNGTTAAMLQGRGYDVIGVDPSVSGIEIAHREFPQCRLESGSSDEDLRARFGMFDTVLSLEVAEHVYSPKLYAKA